MRFYASLLSLTLILLAGCSKQETADYGFAINDVSISQAHQSLNLHLQQELQLSGEAREALEHGVILSIKLELELHNDNHLVVLQEDARLFQVRYLPLSERYQLSEQHNNGMQVFSRLRHVLAAIGNLDVQISTGPLLPGSYELRTRVSLDKNRLPTPMQLPAWFSPEWQHDSEWSVWPFEISA
jgi:hypothetical protein